MFVILQKYDFSSKSQQRFFLLRTLVRCLWYCKSTTFQANHNTSHLNRRLSVDVCDTAKVRLFKQITTCNSYADTFVRMFVILQKYDFSSKSQQMVCSLCGCSDVCDTAKVRLFKQITTFPLFLTLSNLMFVILQKYDFSSKSQPQTRWYAMEFWCLWYCKSTIFQANHNKRGLTN